MHPRNRYQGPHDFAQLADSVPELRTHFRTTPDGRLSLDFADPEAVRQLNRALLLRDYGLQYWDIPRGHLCPGVPGRLDYIHNLADLLSAFPPLPLRGHLTPEPAGTDNLARTQVQGPPPGGPGGDVLGLDVGTGASLIYPILGSREYGWRFVGAEVDPTSLKVARAIVRFNPSLRKQVQIRRQPDPSSVFRNVIRPGEFFHFTMCNPPFFSSVAAAREAAAKKWTKLGRPASSSLNFGGQGHELWTDGGEPTFLRRMIRESTEFASQVGWFTTLVSKKGYLKIAHQELARCGFRDSREMPLGQGGKIRRILAWR